MRQPTIEGLQAEIVKLQDQNEKLQLTADHWEKQYRDMETLTKKLMKAHNDLKSELGQARITSKVTDEEALRIILNK